MIRVAKITTTQRREVENVPDQDLDAGRRTLVADGPEPSSAAAQQQNFHHSPSLPHPPPLAGSYDQWFTEHQGYVADLIRQQQEALQHQLDEMQQQQLAFMQQQQQVIDNIITSMKVQVLPCLDTTLNSLGSNDAEEFRSDPDGNCESTAWHNRHDQLLEEEKMRSLDKMAERSRYGSEVGGVGKDLRRTTETVLDILQEAASDNFAELSRDQLIPPRNLPERPLNVMVDKEEQSCGMSSTQSSLREYDQFSPAVKTTPGTSQQQTLAGPCDARGYRDDVIQQEVNHSQMHPSSATVLPLHSLPVLWPKTTRPWKSENVEFTGLIEVPLCLMVNVNISSLEIQFRSAMIVQPKGIGVAAEDQGRRNICKKIEGTLELQETVGASPGEKFRQRIRSKMEFEPPPTTTTATLPGEPGKRKFYRNLPNAFKDVKVDRVMFGTVDLRTVRLAGSYGSEKKLKASDVPLKSRMYTRSSVSGSTSPTQFDSSKQPTWSLGRPPEQFGGTRLSVFVSSTTSTAPSQSGDSFFECACVLVPIRSSAGRFLMRIDLYHLN